MRSEEVKSLSTSSRIEFTENNVYLVLEGKSFCFDYTYLLKEQLIKHNINLPFNIWLKILSKIRSL